MTDVKTATLDWQEQLAYRTFEKPGSQHVDYTITHARQRSLRSVAGGVTTADDQKAGKSAAGYPAPQEKVRESGKYRVWTRLFHAVYFMAAVLLRLQVLPQHPLDVAAAHGHGTAAAAQLSFQLLQPPHVGLHSQ
jgi:hypothetical protein